VSTNRRNYYSSPL